MRRRVLLCVVPLLLVACASRHGATFGDPEAHWVDATGNALPNGRVRVNGSFRLTIAVYRGAAHCGDEDELFLALAWPLGSSAPIYDNSVRQYVWDPDNSQHFALRGTADAHAAPPVDAADTGYRLADTHLWIAPSDADDYVYLERDAVFQRWPRALGLIGCA